MGKPKKKETKKLSKKSSITTTNNTSVLLLAIIVLLFLVMATYWISKGTFSAGADAVTLDCPSSGDAGTTITCNVNLSAVSGTILSVNANYDFSSGITYSSFTTSSSFESLAITQNGFAVGKVNGVTGSVNVGTLKITLPSAGGNYSVRLTNVELSNSNYEMIELDNVIDTITVESGGSDNPTLSDTFVIDEDNNIIKRLSFGITPTQLSSLMGTSTVAITSGGQPVSTENKLKTGDIAVVTNGGSSKTYTISVLGDVSPDGKIEINDVATLYRYYRKRINLTEPFIAAGEINKDGKIEINDVAALYRYYRGRITSLEVVK